MKPTEQILVTDDYSKYTAIIIYQGQMLSAYEKPLFEGTRYGPFVGPFILKKVRPVDRWKSIRLTDVDFSSAKLIIFCSEQKLAGVCNQILPPTRAGEVMVRPFFFIFVSNKTLCTIYHLLRLLH